MIHPRKLARLVVASMVATALHGVVAADTQLHRAPTKSPTKSAAKPAKHASKSAVAVPKLPVTISITSHIRHGSLIVLLDDVPVFNEKFEKPALLISQTTKWDPLQVPAGKHTFAATVLGTNGKSYVSGLYELEISRTKGIGLRIRMKGNTLTVEPEL